MIAVVAAPSTLVVVLIVILLLVMFAPRAYYRGERVYGGPDLNLIWVLIAIVIVLWLLGVI